MKALPPLFNASMLIGYGARLGDCRFAKMAMIVVAGAFPGARFLGRQRRAEYAVTAEKTRLARCQ